MTTKHIIQGDAIELMRQLPDASVDLILTDPAYSSLEKHRVVGTTTRLKKEWFPVIPNEYFPAFLGECYRVLKKNRHCYIMCDGETSDVLHPMVAVTKFKWWKRIIWDKAAMGMGYHYRARHEFIVFLEKGKRKLNNLGVPDVLCVKRVRGGYPTEKPVELMKILIENSTEAGEVVLDPFCGSGATGVAAIEAGRGFIGFDISETAIELTQKRLEGEL